MTYKIITVLGGQSIWNIAIQEYGSGVDGVFNIAADNGLTLSSQLFAGQKLKIRQDPTNLTVANYFKNNNLHPVGKDSAKLPSDDAISTDLFENITTDDFKNLTV